MRRRELRLALVCYGGVSLAVYMYGMTREIQKLVRASKVLHRLDLADRSNSTYVESNPDRDRETDSEVVYFDLLKEIARFVDLRVVVDVVAGASAGGINAVMLSRALAHDLPMDAYRELWLRYADVAELMDPARRPRKWDKWYLRPVIRHLSGRLLRRVLSDNESREKFSLFIRSPWFRPPFSGDRLCQFLLDALEGVGRQCDPAESLLPVGHKLECLITVTDFYGYPQALPINNPSLVYEREHRHTWRFIHLQTKSGEQISDLQWENIPGLAAAARASSSYAGAFMPFQIAEIDRAVRKRNGTWPTRDDFFRKNLLALTNAGGDPCDAFFIDGGVVNNKPFAQAIGALRTHPAHRQTDRRIVYIEPNPDTDPGRLSGPMPGFVGTLRAALSGIPRKEPIIDDLEWLEEFNGRIRNIKGILEANRSHVAGLIQGFLGGRRNYRPDADKLTRLRARANRVAARDAGYTYAAYSHLKVAELLDGIAALLVRLCRCNTNSRTRIELRSVIGDWAGAHDIISYQHAQDHEARVGFLERFDLGFRMRRLRFTIRAMNDLYQASWLDDKASADLDYSKSRVYELLAELATRLRVSYYSTTLANDSETLIAGGSPDSAELLPILDRLAAELGLVAIDRVADELWAELCKTIQSLEIRRELLTSYLGFPFFDVTTYPLIEGRDPHELGVIKVDRISPADALTIRPGGARATLKGTGLSHFGAFFSRGHRENDYLWGRLHAADRLVDIVLSAVPEAQDIDRLDIKIRLFEAILDAERDHLTLSSELLSQVAREVAALRR